MHSQKKERDKRQCRGRKAVIYYLLPALLEIRFTKLKVAVVANTIKLSGENILR